MWRQFWILRWMNHMLWNFHLESCLIKLPIFFKIKSRHSKSWLWDRNMFLFKLVIFSTLTIFGWAALCPYPGLPAFGTITNDSISWENRRSFEAGEKLEFRCPETSWIDPTQKQTIVCQANGKWSGPLPQCSKFPRRSNFEISRIAELFSFLGMSAGFRAILFSGN